MARRRRVTPRQVLGVASLGAVLAFVSDYRLPRHSLIRGERVRAMIARNLPGTIEELPLDYFCVSGDLPTAELVVHRRGELWRAVGASMSLPGLVTRSLIGNRMLVDGGVLNNLPVDVMAPRPRAR